MIFGNVIQHLHKLARISPSFSPEVRICLRSCIKHSHECDHISNHLELVLSSIAYFPNPNPNPRSSDSRPNHREAIVAKLVLSIARLSFPLVRFSLNQVTFVCLFVCLSVCLLGLL